MDDTVLYPQEEILFVGQLPYKYLVSGIRRMKTKQFTASLVHCSPETCLERKKILNSRPSPMTGTFRL